MQKKIFFISLILIAVVSLAGCKSAQDKVAEKAIEAGSNGKVQVDVNSKKQTIKFSDKEGGGSLQVDNNGNLAVPKEWPKEIKIYPGAKIISVLNNQGELQFVARTADEPAKIMNWYRKELTGHSWNKVTDMDMGDSWLASYKKGKENVSLTLGPNEDGGGGYIISHNYTANK